MTWLLVALLLGAVARLLPITHSLGGDDGVSLYYAQRPWAEIVPTMHASGEVHPPCYAYWLHLWMLIGGPAWSMHEAWLRLSSVIPSVATIAVLWSLVRTALGRREADVAALALALCSFHVVFSDELRMYGLAALWVTLAAWGAWHLPQKGPGPYVAAATLALYTHYLTGFFLLALQGVQGLPHYPRRRLWYANAVVALLFLPWVPRVLEQAHSSMALREPPPAAWFPELMFQLCCGWTIPLPLAGWPGTPVLAPLKWLGLLLPLGLGWLLWRQRSDPSVRPASVAALCLWGPMALAVASTDLTPVHIFEYKYFMMATPFLAFLLGWAWVRLERGWERGVRLAAAGLLLGVNLYSLTLFWTDPAMGLQDWRSAAGILRTRLGPGDTLLVEPGMFSASLAFYLAHGPVPAGIHLVPADGLPSQPAATLAGAGRLWLVDTPAHPIVSQVGLGSWLRSQGLHPDFSWETDNFFPANRILVQRYSGANSSRSLPTVPPGPL